MSPSLREGNPARQARRDRSIVHLYKSGRLGIDKCSIAVARSPSEYFFELEKNPMLKLQRLVSITVMTAAAAATPAAPLEVNAVLGTWWCSDAATDCGPAAFTAFPDGTYFHQSFGIADSDGQPGIERGTYTFVADQNTSDTATFSFKTLLDTNGGWGINPDLATVRVRIAGEQIFVLTGRMRVLSRLGAADSPIVNGWSLASQPAGLSLGALQSDTLSVLSFLPNGKFIYGIESPRTTVEYGNYTWNQLTGALTLANVQKSGTDQSLSNLTNLRVTINGAQLIATSDQGQLVFNATPVTGIPEPTTWSLLIAGLIMVGVRARDEGR